MSAMHENQWCMESANGNLAGFEFQCSPFWARIERQSAAILGGLPICRVRSHGPTLPILIADVIAERDSVRIWENPTNTRS